MTDLHRTVGGLLTRDPLLGILLLNHAAALQGAQPPATSLIVASWADDDRPGAPAGGELFTVDAHVSRDVLHPHRALAAVLDRVHAVLTAGPLAVERLTDTGIPNIGGGTVSRAATWAVGAVGAGALVRPAAGYRWSDAASSSR